MGRENDTEWYEACNPLQGSRGLVPAKFFETVGKTVRDSGDSSSSLSNKSNPGHDSGYAEKTPTAIAGMGMMDLAAAQEMMKQQGQQPLRLSKALGRGGAMIYGVVMYDFKAERPDELEAKEGEAIIVIAQSTPEWFVAKPITRLGGPGLIPVSFIEVRDMTTGAAVTDTQDAVSRAGIPKVEEWKKMAADYKNGSIPLGKFDSSAMSAMNAMNAMNPQGQQGQQGMERMSLSSRQEPNGYGPVSHPTFSPHAMIVVGFGLLTVSNSNARHRVKFPAHLKTTSSSPSRLLYHDIVSPMMFSGLLWKHKWKMADIGVSLAYTRISMICRFS